MQLRVDRIKKSYSEKLVFENVSFNVKNGECFVVIGQNGAGKSTLLQCLSQSLQPDDGLIYFDENVIDQQQNSNLISCMYGQETSYLPHLNARDNVLFFLGLRGYSSKEALIALENFSSFEIINNDLDLPLADFSRGGLQLFFILRCLIDFKAQIYVLDEPLTFLDNEKVKAVCDLLDNTMRAGKAVIIAIQENQTHLFQGLTHRLYRLEKTK